MSNSDKESELQRKMVANLTFLKAKLKERWQEFAKIFLDNKIITKNDFCKLNSLSGDNERVDSMLETVFKSGHCQQFVNVLQRLGYSEICKKIIETDLGENADEQPAGNMTFPTEPEASGETAIIRTVERAFENFGIVFEDKVEKKMEKFMEQVSDKFETLNNRLDEKDAMYSQLQDAYALAREKNNSLTIRLQEMNLENEKNKKEIVKLKSTVKEIQQRQELTSVGSDEVRSLTEEQNSRIKHLEEKCRRKTEDVQRMEREMEVLDTKLKKSSETVLKLQKELEKKGKGKTGLPADKKKRPGQCKDTGMGRGHNKPFFP